MRSTMMILVKASIIISNSKIIEQMMKKIWKMMMMIMKAKNKMTEKMLMNMDILAIKLQGLLRKNLGILEISRNRNRNSKD
jgi:hypothetical protein